MLPIWGFFYSFFVHYVHFERLNKKIFETKGMQIKNRGIDPSLCSKKMVTLANCENMMRTKILKKSPLYSTICSVVAYKILS